MPISIIKEEEYRINIPVSRFYGFSGPITVGVTTPPGFTASLSKTVLTSADAFTILTLTASESVASGINNIVITGTPTGRGGDLTIPIEVVVTTEAPIVANVSFYKEEEEERTVSLVGTVTVSSGSVVGLSWNFGNGTVASSMPGEPVYVAYTDNGTYNVILVAELSNGTSVTYSNSVVINYTPPVIPPRPLYITKRLNLTRLRTSTVVDNESQKMGEFYNVLEFLYNPGTTVDQPLSPRANIAFYQINNKFSKANMDFENLIDIPQGYILESTYFRSKIVDFIPNKHYPSQQVAQDYVSEAYGPSGPFSSHQMFLVRNRDSSDPRVFHSDTGINEDVSAVLPFPDAVYGTFSGSTPNYTNTPALGYISLKVNQKGADKYETLFEFTPTFTIDMYYNYIGSSIPAYRNFIESSYSTGICELYIDCGETYLELTFKDNI